MTWMNLTAFKVSLLATLSLVVLYVFTSQSTLMRNLEAKALDLRFQLRGVKSPGPQVALVLIDDKSIAELGRWPWKRSRFAELVGRLKEAGVKVLAFDLLFTEPEATLQREILQTLHTAFESLGLSSGDPKLEAFRQTLVQLAIAVDSDRTFAAALQDAGNVVLPLAFASAPARDPGLPSHNPLSAFVTRSAYRSLQHVGAEKPSLPLAGLHLVPPIATLGERAKILGHVNVAFDTDGTPRYESPVVEYQGEYYPSLAIQVVREYLGFPLEEVKVLFERGIQLGPLFIPTDEAMRMLVNYYGPPGTFPGYSFADVLGGRFPDSTFKDKIVLIVCLVMIGLLLGWLSPKFPSFWGTLFAAGLGGGYVVGNLVIFTHAGLWVNLFFPLLSVGLNQSAITLFKYLTEERQKRIIRRAFQHYLHPALVDQLSQQPQLLKLGGEEKELTVLFSDVRGFSTIAERLTPEALVHLLNEYFTAMTQLVLEHNGLLDKYIGDAVMAVYGVPLPAPDHAYQACASALTMLTSLKGLRERWTAAGLPDFNIGIGINTATMVVGNMGSDIRFDYTVMGDGVNLASRLEGVNKEYRTNIILSESTWEQVKDRIATRELDVIRVKGKAEPTRIFEALGVPPLPPEQMGMVKLFEEGLHAYRGQRWEHALRLFRQAQAQAPGDFPSQLYIQRCEAFMADPPPADWDGVYIMQTK
ncbi:MAG: CHASE2 domain-containing protein [Nitrospinae bacterium]|nr:CHASE2 domain-containing protein [Nitrospinota bacterium]